MKTYLHRVGRTARAGELGVAYTILRPQEVTSYLLSCLLFFRFMLTQEIIILKGQCVGMEAMQFR